MPTQIFATSSRPFSDGAKVTDADLLAIDRSTVTAPADCGKTHLISQALARHAGPKPILVLTHTNAGVAVLRSRLDKAGVRPSHYRLTTIDGWCMRLLTLFPKRGAYDPAILFRVQPQGPLSRDSACRRRFAPGRAYRRCLGLDLRSDDRRREYQDCSEVQHTIVWFAAQSLRTCVLGDPMQAIFGFQGNALADWDQHVCVQFPLAAELSHPWRWVDAGEAAFGEYLLDVRRALVAGQAIELSSAPSRNVSWVHLDGSADHQRRLRAGAVTAADDEKVLIIADSRNPTGQRQFASQIHGAVTVENVDMRDLVTFGEGLDLASPTILAHVADFATSVMTNTGANNLVARVATLKGGASADRHHPWRPPR